MAKTEARGLDSAVIFAIASSLKMANNSKSFRCDCCDNEFSRNFSLRKHVRKFHPGLVLPDPLHVGRRRSSADGDFTCLVCHSVYDRKWLAQILIFVINDV